MSVSKGQVYADLSRLDVSWWIDTGLYFREHTLFWLENATLPPGSLSLDLGSGPGRFTLPLAKVSRQLVSVDINPAMLRIVKRRSTLFDVADKVEPIAADVLHLPLRDGCFDTVNFIGTLIHVRDQPEALKEAARVTSEGGVALVDQTNSYSLRYLWERAKAAVGKLRRRPETRIYCKNSTFAELERMMDDAGFSLEGYAGFQIIPLLPLMGLRHEERLHLIPASVAMALDRPLRHTGLTRFAYNILIVGRRRGNAVHT